MDFGGLSPPLGAGCAYRVKVHQLEPVEGGAVKNFQGHKLMVAVFDLAACRSYMDDILLKEGTYNFPQYLLKLMLWGFFLTFLSLCVLENSRAKTT